MNAHELTELALRIERLRDEVSAVRAIAPNGLVTRGLSLAGDHLDSALSELNHHIGKAVREEARS